METPALGNTLGAIRIADEVVEIIAGIAAAEVDGVAGMSGGLVGDLAQMLGRNKNMAKGVKVEVGEQEAALDLFLIVEYGVSIPEVATHVQKSVKDAVERMTGLNVVEVNIHIHGIHFKNSVEIKEDEAIRVK